MSHVFESHSLNLDSLPLEETLFHVANGYLGVRGNLDEGVPADSSGIHGAYINGFFDTHPINHPEKLYGFSEEGERIVNVTDVQRAAVSVDGERLVPNPSRYRDYYRYLDMKKGVAGRRFHWESENGKRLHCEFERIASFAHRETFVLRMKFRADESMDLAVVSEIRGTTQNHHDDSDPRVSGEAFTGLRNESLAIVDNCVTTVSRTPQTNRTLTVSVDHHSSAGRPEIANHPDDGRITAAWNISLNAGEEFVLEKTCLFIDSWRCQDPESLMLQLRSEQAGMTFDKYASEQHAYLTEFWENADISVGGDEVIGDGIRFNLYHLLQSAGTDSVSSIAAKGLSGEGYEGHVFWDTEIYMLPFFIYTRPDIARKLLEYRHSLLPAARTQANVLGHQKGAAFPWRTIAGRECSPYYPSGSAQYHINADIAYAVQRYLDAVDDRDFLERFGAELLFETARVWIELGHYSGSSFHIFNVTGPDEYTCMVNDNYYTNIMAQANLENAARAYDSLAVDSKATLQRLSSSIGLHVEEVLEWKKAAAAMHLPYDKTLKLHPQDSSFLQKPAWPSDLGNHDDRPLLLHYHHMTLSRYRICKQADTVLAHVLLGTTDGIGSMMSDLRYYESVTTHDSSLSYAAFAVLAARLGDAGKAYDYFSQTVLLDMENTHGNVKDGIHAANMGGTWMAVVYGFGGFDVSEGIPSFSPVLPDKWSSLTFQVAFRGTCLKVYVTHNAVTISVVSGPGLRIRILEEEFFLEESVSRDL